MSAIFVCRTPYEIVALLAARRRELEIAQLTLDQIAGLADGHTSKIECGTKGLGPLSFPTLASALGLLWLIVDGGIVIVASEDALPARTRRAVGTRGADRRGAVRRTPAPEARPAEVPAAA